MKRNNEEQILDKVTAQIRNEKIDLVQYQQRLSVFGHASPLPQVRLNSSCRQSIGLKAAQIFSR